MPFDSATDYPMRLSVDEARRRIVDLCGQRRVAVDSVPLDRALREQIQNGSIRL